jgi:hypothetical protein
VSEARLPSFRPCQPTLLNLVLTQPFDAMHDGGGDDDEEEGAVVQRNHLEVVEEAISADGDEVVTEHDDDEEEGEPDDASSAAPSSEAGDDDDDRIDNDGDADDSDDDGSVRLFGAARRAAEAAPRRSATLVRFEALQRRQEEQQQGWMIAADRVRSIADMVGRNARVRSLTLTAYWPGFSPGMFQLVCSQLQHANTHLRTLRADLSYVLRDTLDEALAPASPLEAFHITKGPLNGMVTSTLARQLRDNVHLVELALAEFVGNDGDPHRLDDIVSVMEASNFTLQRFSEGTAPDSTTEHHRGPCHHHLVQDSRIGKCLRRNVWIHRVLRDWPNYRVPSQELWPTVLHKADHCPTLLYRFVRIGNLPALCEAVVVSRNGGRKRKERSQ